MSENLILFFFAWFTSTISGIAGFGGSLIMLPVTAHFMDVKNTIPVLTISWMMGNLSRAWFNRKEIKWKPVLLFCTGAVPASVIGSFLFVEIESSLIFRGIGLFLILVVLIRHSNLSVSFNEKWMIFAGVITGFLSAVFGSAGPIGASAFLGLNLPPLSYVSSEAVTAVVMHLTKSIIYHETNLLKYDELIFGFLLGSFMILGSYTAKKIVLKIPTKWFLNFVEFLFIVVGFYMLFSK